MKRAGGEDRSYQLLTATHATYPGLPGLPGKPGLLYYGHRKPAAHQFEKRDAVPANQTIDLSLVELSTSGLRYYALVRYRARGLTQAPPTMAGDKVKRREPVGCILRCA